MDIFLNSNSNPIHRVGSPIKFSIFVYLILNILLVPPAARATDFQVMVGEQSVLSNLTTGDRLVVSLEANRSYCCSISSVNLSDLGRFSDGAISIASGLENNTFPRAQFNGDVGPVIPVGSGHPQANRTRYCFTPADTEKYGLPLAFSVGTALSTKAWCEETTLVGGYNLIATDFAFLEVTVLINSPSANENSVWYRAFSSNNEEIVGEFLGNSRFDHSVHAYAAAQTYAALFLVHSGPPGSISAQVSQYAVESVVPFTFRPLTQTPLRGRVNQ